jgi:hypothetical protein
MEDIVIVGNALPQAKRAAVVVDEQETEGLLLGLLMQKQQQVSEHVRGAKTFMSMLQDSSSSDTSKASSIHKLIVCKGITHDDMFKDDHDEGSKQYVPLASFLNMWGDLNKSHDVLARRKLANAFRPFLVDRSDDTLSLMYLDADQHCYFKYKGDKSPDEMFARRCIGMPDPDEVAVQGYVVTKDSVRVSSSNLKTFDASAYLQSLKALKPGDRVTLFDRQDPRQGVVAEVSADGTTADVRVDKEIVQVDLAHPDKVPVSTMSHEFDPAWVFTRDMIATASDPKDRDVLGKMLRPEIGQVMKQVLKSVKESNVCNLEDLRDHLRERFGYDLDALHADHMLSLQSAILDNVASYPKAVNETKKKKQGDAPAPPEWGAFVSEIPSTTPDQPYERFTNLTRRGDYGLAHVIETSQKLKQAFAPKDSEVASASNDAKFAAEDAEEDVPPESGRPFNVYDLYGDNGATWGSNVTLNMYRSATRYHKGAADAWLPSITGPKMDPITAAAYAKRERAVALLESIVSGTVEGDSEAFRESLHMRGLPPSGRRLDVFRAVVHTGATVQADAALDDTLDMDLDEIFNNMDNPMYYTAVEEAAPPKTETQSEEDLIGEVCQACQVQLTEEGKQFIKDNLDFYNNTDVLRQELQIQLQKLQATQVVAEQKITSGKEGLIDAVRRKVRDKMIETEQRLTSEHRTKSCLICLALVAILVLADPDKFASDLAQVDPGCVLKAKGKAHSTALDATKRFVACIAESMNLSHEMTAISDYVELLLQDKPDLKAKCAAAKHPPWQSGEDPVEADPVEEAANEPKSKHVHNDSASKYVSLLSGILSKQHQMATKYSLTSLKEGGMASAIGRDHKEMSKVMDVLRAGPQKETSTGSTCRGTTVMRRQDDDDLVHAKATGDRNNKNKDLIADLQSWTPLKDEAERKIDAATTATTPPVLTCGTKGKGKGEGDDLYQNAIADIKVIQDWLTSAGHSYSTLLLETINGMSGNALHGYNQGCLMTTLSRLVHGFDADAAGGNATKKQFLGRDERTSVAANAVADPDAAIIIEVRSACGKDFDDIMRAPLRGVLRAVRGEEVSLWKEVRVREGGDAALHMVSTSLVARTLVALARLDFSSGKSPDVDALCRLSSASFRAALDETPRENVEGARNKLLEHFVKQLFARARHSTVDMDDLRVSRQDARVVRDRDILKKMDVMDNELRSQVTQLKNMGLADWRGLVNDLTIVPVEEDDDEEGIVSVEEQPQPMPEEEGDMDMNEDQEDDGEVEIEPEDIND